MGLCVSSPAIAEINPSEPYLYLKFDTAAPEQIFAQCLASSTEGAGATAPSCSAHDHDAWLTAMQRWRIERRIRVGYTGTAYDLDALKWTQSSFIQPQAMVQDRYLYDPQTGRYTVERYLDDLQTRYGGIDAVLIWPTYPNMGIDDRNQLDMVRSMPGGVAGVKQMVADFHRRGVRVFFPMMMWDQGTRPPGSPWPVAIAKLMAEIGADGINGDTQDGVPRAFFDAAVQIRHPLVFEPEGAFPDEALAYDLMSWGYYTYGFVPGVSRFKWLEPRHMVNISDRWNHDKTDNLQSAFFNGVGWESWENVWGIWNGITPRDAEAVRRISTIDRSIASFLASADWEPYYPMVQPGVFASRWPLNGDTVWTIVNRNQYDLAGPQLDVPHQAGTRYFDLYHGTELQPEIRDGRAVLSFGIEAKGYAAILASSRTPDQKMRALMDHMRSLTATPLSDFDHQWKPLPQHILAIAPTSPVSSPPEGMVKIPEGDFLFKVSGLEIEGGNDVGVDVQYPWESSPRRYHERKMHLRSFYIDRYPVTNAQFKDFLHSTHYRPTDSLNFLKDWKDGTYPQGWGHRPVTWVSMEDAQAYAAWAGKRLPHEWEWQYAAQGTDGRNYPWGDSWDEFAVPTADTGRVMRGPDDVAAHPRGASQFGVFDMVGNIWQWTDAYSDDHTRFAILRGGSYYEPQGSLWYFPQARKLAEHGKLLLMAPSMDRSGAVGFRCVRDAQTLN